MRTINILAVDIAGKARNGFALRDSNGELLWWNTLPKEKVDPYIHRQKIIKIINECFLKYDVDIILYEKINLFRASKISLPSILSLCKVQTSILDNFSDKATIIEIPVQSWKAMVLHNYGGAHADKDSAINWVIDNEIEKHEKDIKLTTEVGIRKVTTEFNHDLADAIAMSSVILCKKFQEDYLCNKSKYNVTGK